MRRLIVAAATALIGIAPLPGSASTTIPGVVRQAPAVYRFTIGDAQVTALSDGTMPLDVHQVLKGISPAEMDALLARNFLVNPVQPSINTYLIEMGGRTVLVDTGTGDLFGAGNGGRLPDALAAAGIRPDQIDDVLITHTHPDHIGGLVKNGRIVFPKATVHVGKPDLDFFLDLRNSPENSPNRRVSEQVKAMFKPYMDAGKVRSFERNGEILPAISAELRPGHSPGSAIFRLTSRGQELVIIGDIIHVAAVQFDRPDVTFIFDKDPSIARADRELALKDFARAGTLIAAPHISFPGVGHIRIEGDSYRWVPVEYLNRDPNLPGIKF
jgi:glyoxylase-like metal-dependent hydrolase (beta-lactamase superfamily II)